MKVKRVISVGNHTCIDVSAYMILLKYNVTSSNIFQYSQCTEWIILVTSAYINKNTLCYKLSYAQVTK